MEGENREAVNSIKFMGSSTGRHCVKGRKMIGRTVMRGLTKIWKDREVSMANKKRMVEVLIFTVLL